MPVYQHRVTIAANLKMAFIMLLAGVIFLFAPNPGAFRMLAESGLSILPPILGIFCFIGVVGYLALLNQQVQRWSARWQRTLFMFWSFPLLVYVVTIGYVNVQRGTLNVSTLGYLALYGVIFLLAFAVYNGYSRVLEVTVLMLLILLMLLLAFLFTRVSISGLFAAFNLAPFGFTLLSLIGGIGFSLLFHPRVRALPAPVKRLWFILSELPIPLYALFLLFYVLTVDGSLIVPFILLDLYLLIAVLGNALYPGGDPSRRV